MEYTNEPGKITCPHCGGEHCFEENQTIPSNGDSEQLVTSWMCLDCGYTSTTLNEEGSDIITGYEESTAEIIKDLKWVDPETTLVWYPIVLNFPSFGIIFPDGTSRDDWSWTAAPAVDIPAEEQNKYPIPGQTGQYYTRRIDMTVGKKFDSDKFYDACHFIGFIQTT